ncbi:MAG TPA: hypothetical protein VMV04_15680 [Thermodesulfobacteriota bacterium]|nr:hypothetical protein [Thermodesulfobacteriota bacterium]
MAIVQLVFAYYINPEDFVNKKSARIAAVSWPAPSFFFYGENSYRQRGAGFRTFRMRPSLDMGGNHRYQKSSLRKGLELLAEIA